jgi:hypothetical protein
VGHAVISLDDDRVGQIRYANTTLLRWYDDNETLLGRAWSDPSGLVTPVGPGGTWTGTHETSWFGRYVAPSRP